MSSQGGVYYADVNDSGNLVLYRASAEKSYGFTEDIVLAYNSETNEFSLAEVSVGWVQAINANNCSIKDYKAAVKVKAPSTSSGLDGDWTQTVVFGATSSVKDGAASVVTVTVSGDQVTLENFILTGSTATGTLSGNTITVAAANSGLPTTYGPVDSDIVITLSDDNRTMSATKVSTGYGYGIAVDSWTATK